eukprot:CAMPEP_0175915722 /NCGR_PEP_ID=MMETSP0108-20121206/10466_1 /TAXON_ID=195067 ORGANISM="Goniomonas pacifica, Strain CCMP1869" /NCGR_SAMPLE_ID=MMETSP0108 /ASSEMBLY_ACC=CAM_ASM_000204 /LENGTH=110 /DNA_ID=CAMNT_0017238229 /DNA_START=39 /DNA_END=371 /DNA_ORIENTATION=+
MGRGIQLRRYFARNGSSKQNPWHDDGSKRRCQTKQEGATSATPMPRDLTEVGAPVQRRALSFHVHKISNSEASTLNERCACKVLANATVTGVGENRSSRHLEFHITAWTA